MESKVAVAIVGGGPAGSALAWRLARAGLRVALLDDGRHRAAAPRETLLAAAQPGLQRAGLWQFAAAAAVADAFRHGAIWGSDELVWREPGEAGLLLERGEFDAGLRAAATSVGVERHDGVRVHAVAADGREVAFLDARGQERRVECDHVVLATGRRTRGHLVAAQEVARGPETAALAVRGHNSDAAQFAIVEAVPQGWWWWIGDGAQGGAATLLCDAEELAATGTRRLLAAASAAARGPVAALRKPMLVHATRATTRILRTPTSVLLLGDAATTIDPLASQGVEKALAAADHAAAVLLTALEHPAWWPELRQQHARWEEGLFAAHAQMSQAFLQREERFAEAPFWRRRRIATAPPTAVPRERLVVADDVEEGTVFVRSDDRFVPVEGARHRGTGDAVSHLGYVPVGPVLRAFAVPSTLAEATTNAGRDARLFVLPPQAVHAAALQLYRQGWLKSAANAADNR